MKLIVGLGNPGKKYQDTRHNIGFRVLDELKAKISNDKFLISKQFQNLKFKYQKKFDSEISKLDARRYGLDADVLLAKPQIFMNKSGIVVKKLLAMHHVPLASLYVVHDDLDIPLGKFKVQKGRGPKVHNGLKSIYERVGKEFWHVRVGIENRKGKPARSDTAVAGRDYVLQRFLDEEKKIVDAVIGEVVVRLIEELNSE